jgi:hypothetical protein
MNRGTLVLLGVFGVGLAIGCGDSGNGDGTGGTAGEGAGTVGGGGSTNTGGAGGEGGTAGGGGEGGATAGATCASYCTTVMSACAATPQYATQSACEAECAAFPQGELGATSGNSLECRAYHAGVAVDMPEPHCVHAGPLGSGPVANVGCGDSPCEAFCQIAEEICGGVEGYSFTNADDCNTKCQDFTNDLDFNTSITSGESLACRMYHLSAAANNGLMPHCGHLLDEVCN